MCSDYFEGPGMDSENINLNPSEYSMTCSSHLLTIQGVYCVRLLPVKLWGEMIF